MCPLKEEQEKSLSLKEILEGMLQTDVHSIEFLNREIVVNDKKEYENINVIIKVNDDITIKVTGRTIN